MWLSQELDNYSQYMHVSEKTGSLFISLFLWYYNNCFILVTLLEKRQWQQFSFLWYFMILYHLLGVSSVKWNVVGWFWMIYQKEFVMFTNTALQMQGGNIGWMLEQTYPWLFPNLGCHSTGINILLPCTADAPTGSSIPILSMRGMETQAMIAPSVPISSASHDRYRKHPAVNITILC
jgi:hypothetical protein